MIENEILVTIAGCLVVVLTTIFQIWGISRDKFKHTQKMLELENSLNNTNTANANLHISAISQKKCSLFSHPGRLLLIILGILIFVVFIWWAIHLVNIGAIPWASLVGSLGFISLLVPIISWSACKSRHKSFIRLVNDIVASKQAGLLDDQLSSIQTETPKPTETSVLEVPNLVEPVIEAKIEATPSVESDKPTEILAVKEAIEEVGVSLESHPPIKVQPITIEKLRLPQDSVLKRHFLTQLRTKVLSRHTSIPTDSILKRHFDHLVAGEMQKYIDEPVENVICRPNLSAASQTDEAKVSSPISVPTSNVIEQVSSIPSNVQKLIVPEDSILKRHFLAQLALEVEATLPERPSDSILKRHYDNLLTRTMVKRLEQFENLSASDL